MNDDVEWALKWMALRAEQNQSQGGDRLHLKNAVKAIRAMEAELVRLRKIIAESNN